MNTVGTVYQGSVWFLESKGGVYYWERMDGAARVGVSASKADALRWATDRGCVIR
jgi:hypothetical protein